MRSSDFVIAREMKRANEPFGACALSRWERSQICVPFPHQSLVVPCPVGGPRSGVSALTSLFNTHPPLDSRIEALQEAGGFRLPDRLPADEPFAVELGGIVGPAEEGKRPIG